jgi:hypothetical protein
MFASTTAKTSYSVLPFSTAIYTTPSGYTSLSEITGIPVMNIDYHFEEQSVEAARYRRYPQYFKKPASLEK